MYVYVYVCSKATQYTNGYENDHVPKVCMSTVHINTRVCKHVYILHIL